MGVWVMGRGSGVLKAERGRSRLGVGTAALILKKAGGSDILPSPEFPPGVRRKTKLRLPSGAAGA